ncbi:MAG: aminoacyl-tRNA hydrolase [Dermatophilaceae bacterium]
MGAWVVVGLGNPGPKYAANRHNVGAMVVGQLARRYAGGRNPSSAAAEPALTTDLSALSAHKTRAAVASVRLGTMPGGAPGPATILAVPTAYMNVSGGPVKALLTYYSCPIEQVVVVHDELDLPAGTVRLKLGGGEGGHNGLRSITSALGTRDYHRVRVGIGRPPGRMDPADFVLRDFSATERADLGVTIVDAADAVEALVRDGLAAAQLRFHSPN